MRLFDDVINEVLIGITQLTPLTRLIEYNVLQTVY